MDTASSLDRAKDGEQAGLLKSFLVENGGFIGFSVEHCEKWWFYGFSMENGGLM